MFFGSGGGSGPTPTFDNFPIREINIFEFPREYPDPYPSRYAHVLMHFKFYECTSIAPSPFRDSDFADR